LSKNVQSLVYFQYNYSENSTNNKYIIFLFADWGPKIDVVGFCFLDLASNYEPPESLVKWLEDGDKPIYIGFGSLVSVFICIMHVSCPHDFYVVMIDVGTFQTSVVNSVL